MPRYTFIKYNDGEPDEDMLADTAGISCDVCARCHGGRNRWRGEASTAIACAADVLFHKYGSEYWKNVAEMAADGSPDAGHPEYGEASEMDADMYRCALCNIQLESRDNSEAHYTQ